MAAPVLSDDLRSAIIADLWEGLGVEDISVRRGQHVELIRREVRALRDAGVLVPGFFQPVRWPR